MKTTMESKKYIAKYAFEKLRKDKHYKEASQLANALLWNDHISLSITGSDSKIEDALNYCMGFDFKNKQEPFSTTYYPKAKRVFNFLDDIEISVPQFDKNRTEFSCF